MQININCYQDCAAKPLSKYHLQEDNTHQLYVKNIAIFDLNVVKCYELYYNLDDKENIPNYIRWGALIYNSNFDDIPNIIGNIMTFREREKMMSKLSKLTHDDLFYTEEEALEWAEWERKSIRVEARNEGIEQKTKEIILSMVENKFPIETISKVTGEGIEKINRIIEESEC